MLSFPVLIRRLALPALLVAAACLQVRAQATDKDKAQPAKDTTPAKADVVQKPGADLQAVPAVKPGQLSPGGIAGMAPQLHGGPGGAAAEIGKELPAFSGPGIVFDTPRYNFGRMMAGGAVKHDYWFTNCGKEKLQILSVQPGCGCTTTGAWDREIPPGESGRIPISVNTGKFSGHITKSITVTTNVKESPSLQLQVEGELWQPVQVTPNSIAFGQLTGEKLKQPQIVEAVIQNNTDQPIEIKGVECSNPTIRAEYTPDQPGKTWKLKVSALPPFPTGNFYADIKIKTSSAAVPEISVIASGYVPTPVQLFPPVVALRPVQDAPYEQQVYVRNNSGAAMKLTSVTCSDDKLKLVQTEQPNNGGYIVTIKVPEKYTAPSGGAQITINTDVKTAETMTVKIFQNAAPTTPGVAGAKPGTPPTLGVNQPPAGAPAKPPTPAPISPTPVKPAEPVPTQKQ